MSGLPHLPMAAPFPTPHTLLPAKEWAQRVIARGEPIVERIGFWLAMRGVLPIVPEIRLEQLVHELDAVSTEAEIWLERDRQAKAFAEHVPARKFIDGAGRQHTVTSDGREWVQIGQGY